MKNSYVWVIFTSALFILSVIIYGVLQSFIPGLLALGISAFIFFTVMGASAYNGWTIVPEQEKYLLEILGKYTGSPLSPGLYLLFPWFGLVDPKYIIPMKIQKPLELYQDEKQEGEGDIEFKKGSSSVKCFCFYKTSDPYKVAYASEDVKASLEELVDSTVRNFLKIYYIEEAMDLKEFFCVETVAGMVRFDLEFSKEDNLKLFQEAKQNYKQTDFYKHLQIIGIEVVNLVISDFKLSKEAKALRQSEFEAEIKKNILETEAQQALIRKKITITDAEAEKMKIILKAEGIKQEHVLIGQGEAEQIKMLIIAGIPKEKAAAMLIEFKKWTAIQEGDNKVTLIEGSNDGQASKGAEFGAGLLSVKK